VNTTGGAKPRPLKTAAFAASVAAMLLLAFMAGTAAAQTISFVPAEKTVDPGNVTTFDLVLDSVPHGLAGYEINLSLADTDNAEITSVTYPDWASLNKNSSFPADKVTISGVDLGHIVQNRSTDVLLATITVRGDSPGSTDILISVKELDADGGSPIKAAVSPGRLTVAETTSAAAPTTDATATESVVPPYLLVTLTLAALAGLSVLIIKMWKGKS
jgi:hypothetical protein